MGELIYDRYHHSAGDIEVEVGDTGKTLITVNSRSAKLTPQEAVDLATKIINHCYPFTIPKRIKDA